MSIIKYLSAMHKAYNFTLTIYKIKTILLYQNTWHKAKSININGRHGKDC